MVLYKALVVSFAALLALPAAAGQYTDALGACLADNTTGKERKELAKWIFMGMAAHPDMQGLSNVTATARDETDRFVGETRLITQNCVGQTQAAVKNEGTAALKGAFGTLGQLAMQELMTNSAVASSLSGWEKYLDHEKLGAVLSPK